MLEQPCTRLAQGALAQRLPRHALVELEAAVEGEKEIPPREKAAIPVECGGAVIRVEEKGLERKFGDDYRS